MSEIGQVQVDHSADALYIHLHDAPVDETMEFGDLRNVDYSRDGQVVGVEFLEITAGIRLDGLPERQRLQVALSAHGLGPLIQVVDHIDAIHIFAWGSLHPTSAHSPTALSGTSGAEIDRAPSPPLVVVKGRVNTPEHVS